MVSHSKIYLTRKQKETLDFIVAYLAENHYPPTFAEMRTALHIKSNCSVESRLRHIEQAGYIERKKGRARAITIIEQEPC